MLPHNFLCLFTLYLINWSQPITYPNASTLIYSIPIPFLTIPQTYYYYFPFTRTFIHPFVQQFLVGPMCPILLAATSVSINWSGALLGIQSTRKTSHAALVTHTLHCSNLHCTSITFTLPSNPAPRKSEAPSIPWVGSWELGEGFTPLAFVTRSAVVTTSVATSLVPLTHVFTIFTVYLSLNYVHSS